MSSYLRIIERTHLQTPICTWTDANTGRQVTTIGTVHFADAAYFDIISNIIARLHERGVVVFCEGGTPEPNPADEPATAEEQAILDTLRENRDRERAYAAAIGLVAQTVALPPLPTWTITDINDLEYLRMVGAATILAKTRKVARLLQRDPTNPQALRTFLLAATAAMRVAASDNPILQRLIATGSDDVTIIHRNSRVLAAVRAAADEDAVLVWGAYHLPDIHAALSTDGYTCTDTTWLTAMNLPTILQAWRWRPSSTPSTTLTHNTP